MSKDLSGVEVPRLVKKPGEYKRVETLDDLKAALSDGWVLRLELPAPEPESAASAADLASALTADLEQQDESRASNAIGGDAAVEEPADAESSEKPHKGGKKK